jgi:hypothetical protein
VCPDMAQESIMSIMFQLKGGAAKCGIRHQKIPSIALLELIKKMSLRL